jgi:hypothetical protein
MKKVKGNLDRVHPYSRHIIIKRIGNDLTITWQTNDGVGAEEITINDGETFDLYYNYHVTWMSDDVFYFECKKRNGRLCYLCDDKFKCMTLRCDGVYMDDGSIVVRTYGGKMITGEKNVKKRNLSIRNWRRWWKQD